MKVLLYDIGTLMGGRALVDRGVGPRLRGMIAHNAQEEEREQFPLLRAILGDQKSARVAALIHREEALLPEGPQSANCGPRLQVHPFHRDEQHHL